MTHAPLAACNQRSSMKRMRSFDRSLRKRMAVLHEERDQLQEEVRQLRASVQIYAEIARRLETAATQSLHTA